MLKILSGRVGDKVVFITDKHDKLFFKFTIPDNDLYFKTLSYSQQKENVLFAYITNATHREDYIIKNLGECLVCITLHLDIPLIIDYIRSKEFHSLGIELLKQKILEVYGKGRNPEECSLSS